MAYWTLGRLLSTVNQARRSKCSLAHGFSHGRGADLSRPGGGLGTRSVLSCPGLCRGGPRSLLGPESTGGQPRDGPRAPFLQVLLEGNPGSFGGT